MELKESFGETVRSIRRSKGLAQGEIGTNQDFISELESGLKAPTLPKIAEIAEIAEKLGIHPITLLTATYETMGPENSVELLAKATSELEHLKQQKTETLK
ncbi:transcriptional regulator [Pseudomonas frederiksbergensis]|uniref:Transcriptional regulator n=1 Tax=Pseudomonas frederiksbergensis TaxID=104087 RepID=A0A1J0EQA2_9PSED|nr:helix-turn-helix transcriptional regulator [Pseudomonas frederiksbergensis]APC18330.1 transcriptional regulator [Pseudomonas frederiksbergensis]